MQLITTLASATALLATASATALGARDSNAFSYNNNASCNVNEPKVRVHNRCSYSVNLWSIMKGQGCPSGAGAVIQPGGFYQENYRTDAQTGVSLKISKTDKCGGNDITQLEYFVQQSGMYASNYLDVSYVDCQRPDCPTKQEGFYLKSGNKDGQFLANVANEICPILSCSGGAECAKMAYMNPNDRQTKSCNLKADLDFYMCGSEAPGEEGQHEGGQPSSPPAPSSHDNKPTPPPQPSQAYQPPKPEYKPAEPKPEYKPAEPTPAEITPAPQAPPPKVPNVKTEFVYVTAYEYVNAKRQVHGHRHQHFRA